MMDGPYACDYAARKAAVSAKRLEIHLKTIVRDRNPFSHGRALSETAGYIRDEFAAYGLAVSDQRFWWGWKPFNNVVGDLRGDGGGVFLLGAHYDTVVGSPGADDNASAVAAMLEVARVLAQLRPSTTLRFVAFTLEEYGYVGSRVCARRARKQNVPLLGMIALEMVGFTSRRQSYPFYVDPDQYPEEGNFIALVGNEPSAPLLTSVEESFARFAPELRRASLCVPGKGRLFGDVRLSDHASFWDAGFPALMVTDTAYLRNPNYHRRSDTLDTLDLDFLYRVTQALVCAVAKEIMPS